MQEDVVNHPSHYVKNAIRLEPIDILENFDFCTGNALKYIIRYKDKGKPLEDLEKALFYAKRAYKKKLLKKRYSKYFFFLSKSENPILKVLGKNKDVYTIWKKLCKELKRGIKNE